MEIHLNLKQHHTKFVVKDIVLISFLSIIITVGKQTLVSIPNIEVVSFLFIIYTLVLGFRRTMLISLIFTTTEILIWGFGLWTFGYYLFWPLLIIITNFFKDIIKGPVGWAMLSGLFGLSFGLLFAIYTAPLTNINIFVYWMSGITFDLVHMIGNFTIMFILYKPVKEVLARQISNFI